MGARFGSADRAAVGLGVTASITRWRGRLDGDGLGASVEITLTATLVCLAVIAP